MSTLLRARVQLPFAMLCAAAHPVIAQDTARLASPPAVTCQVRTIAASRFTICEIPRTALGALEIAPAPDPASRTWTIARLDATLRASGQRLVMATNAGIFGRDGRALGLLVSGGRRLAPLDSSAGPEAPPGGSVCDIANFYCPPNGVFYIAGDRAAVVRTDVFRRDTVSRAALRLATQSGPMLVEQGEMAREFPESWRRRIPRNAACVRGDGTVVLTLGEGQTQRSFATALRDSLGCRDALFLDGSISSFYAGGCLPPEDADYSAIIFVAVPATERQAPPCVSGSGRLVSTEPYSTVTVRVGATRVRPLDQMHRFYPGDRGGALQIEMPFEFGRLGLTVDQVTLRSAVADSADVRTRELAVDWRVDVPLMRRMLLRPGLRVGLLDLHLEGPQAGPGMADMNPFMAGPTMTLDLSIAHGLSLTGEGAWLIVPSSSRSRLGYLTAFVSYAVDTPRLFRRILRRTFAR